MSFILPKIRTIKIIAMALVLSACEAVIKDWVKGSGDKPPVADTGSTIAPTTLTWDFTDPTKYSYDSNYVEITSGSASIKQVDQLHAAFDFNSGTNVGTYVDGNNNVTLKTKSHTSLNIKNILPARVSSLVGYWRMDGNANDESVNSMNGVLENGAAFTTNSVVGPSSAEFDGSDDRISITPDSSLYNVTTVTVAAWVRLDLDADSSGAIFAISSTLPTNNGYQLYYESNGFSWRVYTDTTPCCQTVGSLNPPDGKWHLVAGTWDGTSIKIYVDSVLQPDQKIVTGPYSASNGTAWIGRTVSNSAFTWNGEIDELVVFNTALSQMEIESIYNSQKESFSDDTSLSPTWNSKYDKLFGHWKMDGNWLDSSGNGNHGIATNGAIISDISKVGSHSTFYDGIDDFVSVTNDIGNISDISTTLWVKNFSAATSVGEGLIYYNFARFDIAFTPSSEIQVWIQNNSAWHFAVDSPIYNDWDIWHHIAMVYDGATVKLYRDGELVATSLGVETGDIPAGGTSIRIGRDSNGGGVLNGLMDEVAIWKTNLTASDIKNIYDRQKQKYAGHFDSPIIDLGASGTWENFVPKTTLPFYKELPSTSESASDYSFFSGNLSNGLTGIWHLDGAIGITNDGTSVIDSSSGGNNGIIYDGNATNNIAFVKGYLNQSIELDGVNDGVIIGDVLDQGVSNFSLSAWVSSMATVLGNNNGIIYKKATALISDEGYRLSMPNGGFSFRIGDGTNGKEIVGGSNFNDGLWHHVVAMRRDGNLDLYVDGLFVLSDSETIGNIDSPTILAIGGLSLNGIDIQVHRFDGGIDEVAIWNRALTAVEVNQLYRRGANRIRYQVKSCTDSACKCKSLDVAGDINDCDGDGTPNASDTADIHFSQWLGKDGVTGESFSELQNCSVIDALTGDCDFANLATVNSGSANFNFSSYPAAARPANNRYFQYRVLMEAEDNLACSNATCLPELTSVEVGPTGRSFGGIYSITTTSPVTFTELTSMSFNEGGSCSLTYQLSPDGSTFYYWNSSTWVPASGVAQSSTAADVSTNVTAFTSQIGAGSLYWKAFMNSTTAQSCRVDEVSVTVFQ